MGGVDARVAAGSGRVSTAGTSVVDGLAASGRTTHGQAFRRQEAECNAERAALVISAFCRANKIAYSAYVCSSAPALVELLFLHGLMRMPYITP